MLHSASARNDLQYGLRLPLLPYDLLRFVSDPSGKVFDSSLVVDQGEVVGIPTAVDVCAALGQPLEQNCL